jgi:hypothetical protein
VDNYTKEETISMEMNYYLRMLANHKLQEEEVEYNRDCCYDYEEEQLRVSPEYMLTFPRLKKLCPDVKTLMYVVFVLGGGDSLFL